MTRSSKDLAAQEFTRPDGVRAVELCRVSHQAAGEDCPAYVEFFKPGDVVPEEACAVHQRPLRSAAVKAHELVRAAC